MEIIIGIMVVIAAIAIFGLYSRKRIYTEVDRLEAWKIDMLNRPVTDEIAKVKELNMTGQTEKMFERWRNEWDEIVTVALPNVEELLFDAEEYADKYRFGKAKQVTGQIDAILKDAEDSIANILVEIKELVGSEEKNRIEIEELLTLYRELKKKLLAHRHTFGISEAKFEMRLQEAHEKFAQFDVLTKEGNYLEAREIVLIIRDLLETTEHQMVEVSQLLQECQSLIPNQLDEIEDGVSQMEANGYSLEHIQAGKEIEKIRIHLSDFINLIGELELENVKKGMAEIKEAIETLLDLLQEEVEAHQYVIKETAQIENSIQELIENSKQTENETAYVQQSYRLTDGDIERHQDILKQIKQVIKQYASISSRLNEDHIAYSIIKKELETVYEKIEVVKQEHSNYTEMLQSLRKDEMKAREKIKEMKSTLIDAKRVISKSNIPGLPKDYLDLLHEAQQNVHQVIEKLDEKPLNMNSVNETIEQAQTLVIRVHETAKELVEQVYLAEKVIQYGNRYRSHNKKVAESLYEAENFFRNYDYGKALEQAATALEEIDPDALKKIEKLIENE